jgi:hypothetical protein
VDCAAILRSVTRVDIREQKAPFVNLSFNLDQQAESAMERERERERTEVMRDEQR